MVSVEDKRHYPLHLYRKRTFRGVAVFLFCRYVRILINTVAAVVAVAVTVSRFRRAVAMFYKYIFFWLGSPGSVFPGEARLVFELFPKLLLGVIEGPCAENGTSSFQANTAPAGPGLVVVFFEKDLACGWSTGLFEEYEM